MWGQYAHFSANTIVEQDKTLFQTKKKVPSGVTTYNKNKQALVIKKIRVSDFGKYMTGDKKTTRTVVNAPWL